MIAECQPGAVVKSLILKGILITVWLGGCAVKPLPELDADAELEFRVMGKFGIRQGDEGFSAQFSWLQYTKGYEIEVWGLLGQGRTQLQGDSGSMAVKRGTEVIAQGLPQDVMTAHLGWSVPISVLPAWIQGRPAEGFEYEGAEYDDFGRFSKFTQAGWQVSLQRYLPRLDQGDFATPGKILAASGTRRVTVIVRDYGSGI